MRYFHDQAGTEWFVAVGKESYGSMVLIFARSHSTEVRKYYFEASGRLAAERELDSLSDAELAGALADSVPWDGSE